MIAPANPLIMSIGAMQEIEETAPLLDDSQPNGESRSQSATTKVPEVEIHLYRCGKGPIDVFKSNLGGWEQDQLEVRAILEKYGLKSIFAYNVEKGRGVPIRFQRNGRSVLTYRDGAVVYIDGEPQVISLFFLLSLLIVLILSWLSHEEEEESERVSLAYVIVFVQPYWFIE